MNITPEQLQKDIEIARAATQEHWIMPDDCAYLRKPQVVTCRGEIGTMRRLEDAAHIAHNDPSTVIQRCEALLELMAENRKLRDRLETERGVIRDQDEEVFGQAARIAELERGLSGIMAWKIMMKHTGGEAEADATEALALAKWDAEHKESQ